MKFLEIQSNQNATNSVPWEWETLRFGEIGKFQYGYTATATDEETGIKFLRITDIKDSGQIFWKEVPSCTISTSDFEKFELEDGDILIARIGATTGKSCIIKRPPNSVFGSYLIRVRVDKIRCDPDFIFYYTLSRMYWSQINANKEGKLKKGVSASFLQTLLISNPSKTEQQKIGFVLSRIRQAIEQQDKIVDATKKLKKSLMRKLFTEGIGHTEFKETEIGEIPNEWSIKTLGHLANFQYGYTATAAKDVKGPKFLRITDIDDEGQINWSKVPHCELGSADFHKYSLLADDILVARIGATTGKTCIIKEMPEAVFGSYLIRMAVSGNSCLAGYVYHFTQTRTYWSQINANKEGKLKKGVSAAFLRTLKIPSPPQAEQAAIVHVFNTINKKIEVERTKKQVLSYLFKTMLQELMTGEIRVKDLDFRAQSIVA